MFLLVFTLDYQLIESILFNYKQPELTRAPLYKFPLL